jgi:hypothetical protein
MKFNNGDPVRFEKPALRDWDDKYGRINVKTPNGYSVFIWWGGRINPIEFREHELEKVSEEEYRANEVLSS